MVIGGLGEPLDPSRSDPSDARYWLLKGLGVAGGLGLVLTGVETTAAAIPNRP